MAEEPIYNYLEELNQQQRDAVVYMDGPSLVIAGAGSGKTRVLTYKIVHLLRHGYEPYRILALTFTNKAAREMKERIRTVVGEKAASKLVMGTFHSIFLNILRRHSDRIGYKNGFSIYDTADSKSLIKMIVKDMGLDDKVYKPATLLSVISNAKNRLTTPEQYLSDPALIDNDRRAKRPMTGKIFAAYCQRCRVSNAMDFDDILIYMNTLLRDNPDILRHYQDFFRYILVDEYQDTNFAQHLIVSQLAGEKRKICVVGDDAQSIYSFRGAEIKNILNLERRLPGLKIFKLERNYRSTQNIIDAAGSLIDKNTYQMKKNVYSENKLGEKIEVISAFSDLEEAFLIANLINQSKLSLHDSYDDYAVLYRTNAQSRALEESLRKRSIPYRIYGSLSFYQRKEVKDAIAYFRLAVNPNDDESLRRIINFPARGIGDTTMKKLTDAAITKSISLWELISNGNLKEVGLNSGTINKITAFKSLIEEFIRDNESGSNAYELAQLIYNRTGLLAEFAYDTTPESISRHENLTEIMSGLKEFVEIKQETGDGKGDMQTFLSEVMLATDQDEKEEDNQPKVTLMTVHAAKGLEFKHIFIVGVEEDLFPAAMSQTSMEEVEEERRLLYVAITRAKDTCTITYAGSRFRNGQTVLSSPSRFIGDINPRFLNLKNSSKIGNNEYSAVNPYKNYQNNRSAFNGTRNRFSGSKPASASLPGTNLRKVTDAGLSNVVPQHTPDELKVGDSISHPKFGIGEIISIDSISGEPSITVEFREMGQKKLLLRFAKFDIL
ncbi:MAG: UvrD-helicase domain-containing protein [Muribaculaceae bacterium]|nr:UvrD-helicase domain-containing protein [Muribaculaceae bacterium]